MNYYFNVRSKTLHTEDCRCVKTNAGGKFLNTNWIEFGSLRVANKHCKDCGIKYKCCKLCIAQ